MKGKFLINSRDKMGSTIQTLKAKLRAIWCIANICNIECFKNF